MIKLGVVWCQIASHSSDFPFYSDDTVSHCDVDLCPAEPGDKKIVEFDRRETITVSTDFLPPGLHVEQSTNGMRFRGPVQANQITKTLQHLKWFNLEPEPPRRRCFRLICLAPADSHFGPRLMVQSNVLQETVSIFFFRYICADVSRKRMNNKFRHVELYRQFFASSIRACVLALTGPSTITTDVIPT